MSDLPTIRIIALGASLIEGFIVTPLGALKYHPCTIELERLLAAQFPKHRIEIVNCGNEGEQAVNMPARLQKLLAKDSAYDLAIFLGGTNDLFWAMNKVKGDQTAEIVGEQLGNAIASAIETMVAAVHAVGADAICQSVPEHGLEFDANVNFRHATIARNVVKERLSAFADSCTMPLCSFFDLAAAIPFHSPENYYSDSVHFNEKGYDLMGAQLFQVALPLLEKRLAARNEPQT